MPPLRKFAWTGFLLALIGWGGVFAVIFLMLPTLGPRWLFYFLLTMALVGTVLPLIAYLHKRFPSETPASGGVILRQAIWIGIYGDLIVWLLPGEVLNFALALFLAAGFGLVEFLIRLRERSQWQPRDLQDE
ncbi:MAG: hypothetical protein IT308_06310 [Anaerolineaceae bacterium]|nr:hypothetical protein [Anaerolineaceae bacterium]